MNKNTTNPFDILSNLEFSEQDYTDNFAEEKNYPDTEAYAYRSKNKIRVWLQKKKRAGKPVSVITGLTENKEEIKKLAKLLKSQLGVGGSFSSDEIIIQGQNRDKIIEILKSQGFKDVKKAGG